MGASTRRVCLAAWAGAALVGAGAPAARAQDAPSAPPVDAAAESPGGGPDAPRAYRDALASGDERAIARALDRLIGADEAAGLGAALDLLRRGAPGPRAIAVDAIAAHASVAEMGRIVESLPVSPYRDERRRLVWAIGATAAADPSQARDALAAARDCPRDPDELVGFSMINALALAGVPDAVDLFIDDLPQLPSQSETWTSGGPALIRTMAYHGAFYALTGYRAETSTDAIRWWKRTRQGARGKTAGEMWGVAQPAYPKDLVRDRFATPHFDVYFKLSDPARDIPGSGLGSWTQLTDDLERIFTETRDAAAGVFGPVHLPVLRLEFLDERNIGGRGVVSMGFYGYAFGNGIAMRMENWQRCRAVLAHELIHIIQSSQFERQPRWLKEGVAMSLTESRKASPWKPARVAAHGLDEQLQRGLASWTVHWDSGSTSGPDERMRYQGAYLLVDYLRHSGIPAAETRLYFLMSRLSRGESPDVAVKAVYGRTPRQMDEDVRRWIAGRAG